jgi:iron complex transport system substrate-binding protein
VIKEQVIKLRIVSLCPSNTELLGFMGLTSSIVGVDKYSDWPAAIDGLPRLGSDMDIDMDAVEALQPDLVVASLTVPGMEKNIEGLKERNLPYIILNPKSLADIGQNMLIVGEATDTLDQAKVALHQYQQMIDHYAELSRKVERKPSLYWEWWPKPVYTPGGGNWLTEISELAGAKNIFADDPRASVKTELEEVLSRVPDYILLAWVGVKAQQVKPEAVKKRPGWSELEAVQQGRVHIMEEPLYCRPSPRLIMGLQKLAAFLHPEIYPAQEDITSAIL